VIPREIVRPTRPARPNGFAPDPISESKNKDRKEVGKERKTFPAAFSPTVQFTKLILITSGNMVFR
jgi:hypothetical protein